MLKIMFVCFAGLCASTVFFCGSAYSQDASSRSGTHKELETGAGAFRVGVSEFDSDPRKERTAGVAEIGYVLRGEYGSILPDSVAIIPFIRSHFESDDSSRDANARSGVGVDFEISQLRKNVHLVFRLTADESDSRYSPNENDSSIATSAGVFVRSKFGGVDERHETSRRIRRLQEPIDINVELSKDFFEPHEIRAEKRRFIHYLILSYYIFQVRSLKENLEIQESDPFQKGGQNRKEQREWLEEHLIERYPLYYFASTESGSISQYSGRYKLDSPDLLSARFLINDFLDELESQNFELN